MSEQDEDIQYPLPPENAPAEIIQEIQDYIRNGFCMTPHFARQILYLKDPTGKYQRVDLRGLDPELAKKIREYARDYAAAYRIEHGLAKNPERTALKKKTLTGKLKTLEALDRSHAKIVTNLTEATGWFADVLAEVGFYATLIAMQHAKVPPDELYDEIVRFKDPNEFAEFVKNHLTALLEAKEDAHALVSLRKTLDRMEVKIVLLEEALERLKMQRDEAILMVHTATAAMCDDCLKRFMTAWIATKYGLSARVGAVGVVSSGAAGGGVGVSGVGVGGVGSTESIVLENVGDGAGGSSSGGEESEGNEVEEGE